MCRQFEGNQHQNWGISKEENNFKEENNLFFSKLHNKRKKIVNDIQPKKITFATRASPNNLYLQFNIGLRARPSRRKI